MYNNDDISLLSSEELSKALQKNNLKSGPITKTTRRIFENRLRSHLDKITVVVTHENDKNNKSVVIGNKYVVNDEVHEELTKPDEKKPDQNSVQNSVQNGVHILNKIVVETDVNKSDNEVITNNNDNNIITEVNNDTKDINKNSTADTKSEETSSTGDPQDEKKEKNSVIEVTQTESNGYYYGVCLPYSPARIIDKKPIIFTSQQEALNTMKGYKGSRFKMFDSKIEAENFSLSKPNQLYDKLTPSTVNEPKNIFKVPSFQETIKFRQHVEKGKLEDLENCLCNPRYLISTSDIPVILQEGSRMNAVHVGSKYNRLKPLKIIMKHLQSHDFFRLIYPDATVNELEFRKNHLIDLYLNTPEKILCDTPLHMACKFGYASVVKYLLTFKQLKADSKNIDRKTGEEVICDRANVRGMDKEKLRSEIKSLFEDKAYIPLYEDDEMQSKVGCPIISLSPNDIYSCTKKVKAFAGPMTPDQASTIHLEWKKSPRNRMYSLVALSDYEKGMERIGRSIALHENVPFTEYWPFLNKFANFQTIEGLKKLEKYLKSKNASSTAKCINHQNKSSSSKKKNLKSIRTIQINDTKRKLVFDEPDTSRNTNEQNGDTTRNTNEPNGDTPLNTNEPNGDTHRNTNEPNGDTHRNTNEPNGDIKCDVSCHGGKDLTNHKTENIENSNHSCGSETSLHTTNDDSTSDAYTDNTDIHIHCPCGDLSEECCNCTIDMNLLTQSVSFKSCSVEKKTDTTLSDSISEHNLLSNMMENLSFDSPLPTVTNPTVKEKGNSDERRSCCTGDHLLFIAGKQPSKQDLDVLRALDPALEMENYPNIQRWKLLMESFSEDAKSSWPSPGSPRYTKTKSRILWTA